MEEMVDIGICLPCWASAIEIDGFIIIRDWMGIPLSCFSKELLPLSEEAKNAINENLKKEEEIFARLFGY